MKVSQADAKIEQNKKSMMLAQHDVKSNQIIQIWYGYATYFTMLQTMVQNSSSSDKEREQQKIICKQFKPWKVLKMHKETKKNIINL
jgi:hypothetical protein